MIKIPAPKAQSWWYKAMSIVAAVSGLIGTAKGSLLLASISIVIIFICGIKLGKLDRENIDE